MSRLLAPFVAAALVAFFSASASASVRLLAVDEVHGCAFLSDGRVVAATDGGLAVEEGPVFTALDGLPDTRVSALAVEGDTALVETPLGLARVDVGARTVTRLPGPVGAPAAPTSFEIHEGAIVHQRTTRGADTCIATSAGLFVGRNGVGPTRIAVAPSVVALPTADVSALAVGEKGAFVGTFDRGVYFFDGTSLHPVAGATNPNVNALAWDSARHALWIATARGLERCADEAPFKCQRIGGAESMHALLLTADGIVAGGEGSLLFLDPEGRTTGATHTKEGAPFRSVWALAMSAEGVLFAGTTSGIYSGTPSQFVNEPSTLQRAAMVTRALPDDWVTALAFQGSKLVAGTYNAGLVVFATRGDRLVPEHADPSLGYVNIDGIRVLPDGRLAIATMDGLRVGQVASFSTVATLGRDVTAVGFVADGNAWVASRRGIARLPLSTLQPRGSRSHAR